MKHDSKCGGVKRQTVYKNSILLIVTAINVIIAAIILFSSIANAAVIENDLGVVLYTEAPKTWTIDVPQEFNKVEIGVYAKGKTEVNQYSGWNGYLKLNGQYAWKFVRYDTKLGGIFYDYINGAEIQETTGRGKWLDVTSKISAGGNTITYYHYTGGDGIGVKVRIYTTTAITQTPTPTPTQTQTPVITPTPAITATPATSASVSLSGLSSSYVAGDTLSATVYVKNNGGTSHAFPVGFSVRDPQGNWKDVPYKTVTLNTGADTSIYFEYNIPSYGPAGTWTAGAAVWDRDAGGGVLQTRYDYDEQSFSVSSIPATATPAVTVTGATVQEESEVRDLGVVLYTEAPKTWTIDVPQNFNKVEAAVYAKGKDEANQFGGWNGYLKLNGEYAWKFVRHDTKLGGIFYDYIRGQEVQETTVRGKWFDVTDKVKAGKNTISFYHYTGGDGIGVKVRIYSVTTTPTSIIIPMPTTLIITPTSTQFIPGKYTREGPKTIDEQIRIQCESSDSSEISLFKISNETGYICSNNVAYKVFKVSLRTVDPHGAPIGGVEVYKQVFDKRTEIIFDIVVGMATDWALGHLNIPTKILTVMNVKDILELPGKIKLFVEGEYLIIGKTDSNGYIEAWVKENQKIRFKAIEQIPTTFGPVSPVVETDHSIRKVLGKYLWTGDVTITASSPRTENLQLRRGANVVVVYEKGEDGVSELEKFFKEEFGIEIVKMTLETLKAGESGQNLTAQSNINNADIFIYLLRADDTSTFLYYGNRFMPTIKTEGFIFTQIFILDENERKYTDKSNGVVSYRFDTNSGINYYLIAGIGNEGLNSAVEAFKSGEWKIVVGPEPIQPAPAKKPWWRVWQ